MAMIYKHPWRSLGDNWFRGAGLPYKLFKSHPNEQLLPFEPKIETQNTSQMNTKP